MSSGRRHASVGNVDFQPDAAADSLRKREGILTFPPRFGTQFGHPMNAVRSHSQSHAMTDQGQSLYGGNFHQRFARGSSLSASIMVPMVVELVRPRSVLDVGCGVGTWLAAFRDQGVEHVVGLDGKWVKRQELLIPDATFIAADLEKPLPITGRFDLAISLEVAEHLQPRFARAFVEGLIRLAPVVLFSAAYPDQTGVGHVNERWPGYWKRLFNERGFLRLDPFRPRVWRDERVEWWYRRNTFLYVNRDLIQSHPGYQREYRLRRQKSLRDIARHAYLNAQALLKQLGPNHPPRRQHG
jgi:SAM-dependent methyltransferase